MLLQHSRRDARVDADGDLITLEEQDRGLWHRDEIAEAEALLSDCWACWRSDRMIGPYRAQAEIALPPHARADRLGRDRRAVRALGDAHALPGRRAQPGGGGGDGRRPRRGARARRRARPAGRARWLSPAAAPRALTCCAAVVTRAGDGGVRAGAGAGAVGGGAALPQPPHLRARGLSLSSGLLQATRGGAEPSGRCGCRALRRDRSIAATAAGSVGSAQFVSPWWRMHSANAIICCFSCSLTAAAGIREAEWVAELLGVHERGADEGDPRRS